jgi:serine phosphatase RsbU (regulator of sigma subunit)/anti-sigma regulatory factor (Ser/Thr protein kinase)
MIRLAADRRAPAQARAAVTEVLHEIDLAEIVDDAVLLVTELVTNAVIHAGTETTLRIHGDETHIRVTVGDRRRSDLPEIVRDAPSLATGGRGLLLVDRIAYRWGTVHEGDGKSVWFELRPSSHRPDRAAPLRDEIAPAEDPLVATLTAENDRLRRADLRRRATLTFLAEASELLAQSLDILLTIALIPRLVVPRLGVWSAVLGDDAGEIEVASAAHTDEAAIGALRDALRAPAVRRSLLGADQPGHPITLPDPLDGVAVPLIARGRRFGVLAIGRPDDRRHDADEIATIVDLARRSALALDNAALHAERARISDTLQQTLLPPALPVVSGFSFGAEYIPTVGAADVGGDFYDVLALGDERWLMVIGDVSGKGIAAAAVTGLVRDVIRILAREGRSVPEILDRVNEALAERGAGRFATLAAAEVEADGGKLRVRLHLAGHDRPVLVRTDGVTTPVGIPGTALGLLDHATTTAVDIGMEPGDTLVFFTDGVTERRRGPDLFGLDRLHATLAPLAGHDADVVAARLRSAAMAFSTETPRDDIAILTLHNDVAIER